MRKPAVRKQNKYVPLTKKEFRARFDQKFFDPAFEPVRTELDKVFEIAWDGYINSRKAPRTKPAGAKYANPAYELSVEWSQSKRAIDDAARRHRDANLPSRIL